MAQLDLRAEEPSLTGADDSQCVTTVAAQGKFLTCNVPLDPQQQLASWELQPGPLDTPPYKLSTAWLFEWERIWFFQFWNAVFLGLVIGMKPEVSKMWHLYCLICIRVGRSGCWVAPAAFFNLWALPKPSVPFAIVHHMWSVSWAPLGFRRLCFSVVWRSSVRKKEKRELYWSQTKTPACYCSHEEGNWSLIAPDNQKLPVQPEAFICALWSVQREGALGGTILFLGVAQIVLGDAWHVGAHTAGLQELVSPPWDERLSKKHCEDHGFWKRPSCFSKYHQCIAGRSVAMPLQALAQQCVRSGSSHTESGVM